MKNLKKVLAVMTSVAALCTSMSAFAAGATTYGQTEGKTGDTSVFSFTYDGTANAINNITLTEAVADGDVTLLVVKPGVQRQNVTQSDIWYIDQTTKTAGFGTIARGLLDSITFTDEEKSATTATTKTAPVYVGYKNAAGEFAIAEAAVSATYTPETQATTVTVSTKVGNSGKSWAWLLTITNHMAGFDYKGQFKSGRDTENVDINVDGIAGGAEFRKIIVLETEKASPTFTAKAEAEAVN